MNTVPQTKKPSSIKKKKIQFLLDSNSIQRDEPNAENDYFPPPMKTPNHKFAFSSNFAKTFQDFNFVNNATFTQASTPKNSIFIRRSSEKAMSSKALYIQASPRNAFKSCNNLKKFRDPEEIAQAHNLKYSFKFPLQYTEPSNKNNNYFPSLTKLNKELIHTSIFQGVSQIEYSKKNYDFVMDYFHNKEEDCENKAKRLGKEFDERKAVAVGDLIPPNKVRSKNLRLTQGTFEKFKTKQKATVSSKQKIKSVMFAHQVINIMKQDKPKIKHRNNNITNQNRALSEPSRRSRIINKENNQRQSNLDKVDFELLKQKISIYNLLKNSLFKPHSSSSLDVDMKEDLGKNFVFGTNHSVKYGLKPHFLKTKFKRQTVYKYDGITGKFFGMPV